MPSFADSIFLFVLALLLFGPKKLPVLARELGKWVGEFRRASNEFKMQMEEELRLSEQQDRQKQIAAMEAAAPLPPPLEEPSHPHLPSASTVAQPGLEPNIAPPELTVGEPDGATETTVSTDPLPGAASSFGAPVNDPEQTVDGVRPIPIATSGDLHMMPPATGLPTPRSRKSDPLGGLLDSIPEAEAPEPAYAQTAGQGNPENGAHAD